MTTKPFSSRRKFLATLGVGGAAAAVAITRQGGEPERAATATPQGKGYQLTEHVRNYYRTAKV
jgi:hypothetical protein